MLENRLLVSRRQAIELKKRGYNLKCSYYLVDTLENPPMRGRKFNCLSSSVPTDWNSVEIQSSTLHKTYKPFISVPTILEALCWLNKLDKTTISSLSKSISRTLNLRY